MASLTDRLRDMFDLDLPRADEPGGNGSPAAAIPVAHGHELLGPCRECGGYWTRELVRGQKPLTCPVCKREGPPQE